MKTKLLLPFLLVAFAHAQQASVADPEMAKIDARLKELAEIWRQDTGVINKLTNFKRTPVQEGTKAYYQCLEASKRIQQAEAEAKTLKQRKADLESKGGGADSKAGDSQASSQPKQESDEVDKFSIRQFDAKAIKQKGEAKKSLTPVFKGFYLGMPAADALGLINDYMGLPQADEKPVVISDKAARNAAVAATLLKALLAETPNAKNTDIGDPFRIARMPDKSLVICRINGGLGVPFAILDEDLNVIEFRVNEPVRDKLFESKGMPLNEFMKMFSEAYGIDRSIAEALPTSVVDGRPCYVHRDEKGYEITFWADKKIIGDDDGLGGAFWLKKIGTEGARKSKFD